MLSEVALSVAQKVPSDKNQDSSWFRKHKLAKVAGECFDGRARSFPVFLTLLEGGPLGKNFVAFFDANAFAQLPIAATAHLAQPAKIRNRRL